MKEYTTEELERLVDLDLFYPDEKTDYHKMQRDELETLRTVDNWDTYLKDTGCDLVHEQLWWDCCEVINELAQLVLDEREKTNKIISDLKQQLASTINDLEDLR